MKLYRVIMLSWDVTISLILYHIIYLLTTINSSSRIITASRSLGLGLVGPNMSSISDKKTLSGGLGQIFVPVRKRSWIFQNSPDLDRPTLLRTRLDNDYESENMFNVMKIQFKEVYPNLDFEYAFPSKNFLFALFKWKNLPIFWSKIRNEIEISIFTFEFYWRKIMRYHDQGTTDRQDSGIILIW